VPAVYPLDPEGASALVPIVRAYIESERRP